MITLVAVVSSVILTWIAMGVFTYYLYAGNLKAITSTMSKGIAALGDNVMEKVKLLDRTGRQHVQWQNELHAVLLREQSKEPKKRIYAFNVTNLTTRAEEIKMIVEDSLDVAEQRLVEILDHGAMTGVKSWVVKSHSWIDVPVLSSWSMRDTLTAAEKEVEQKVEFDRPILAYANYLEFARDKFAKTPTEKRTINNVIFRIREYEHSRAK